MRVGWFADRGSTAAWAPPRSSSQLKQIDSESHPFRHLDNLEKEGSSSVSNTWILFGNKFCTQEKESEAHFYANGITKVKVTSVWRGETVLREHSLTGFWSRPAMYKLFQLRRSSIKTLVLITPYLISWKRKEMCMKKSKLPY